MARQREDHLHQLGPVADDPRGRWWHFGLDATIGIAGMGLFFWVLSTLPGDPVGAPSQRGFLLALSAAQLLDLVALNVVLVRGLPLPTPRAFRMYMAALGLEASFLRRIETVNGKADMLNGYFVRTGHADGFAADLARYRAITAADIQRVATRYLTQPRVTLSVVPQGKPELAATPVKGTP